MLKRLITVLVCCLFILFSSFTYSSFENNNPFIVVLDAGHGGHDPGNLGNGYMEKNIALKIVLEVGRLLGPNKDIKVIYTRKDDSFVDLFVRGEIANKANADLFVSVHCDSHTSDAHGAGTFVLGLHANKQNFEIAKKENSVIYLEDNYESRYADYDINSPESVIGLTIMQEEFLDYSIMLAKMMQDNFSKNLKRNDRKVKQAGFIVLHQTFMPSVLVETGFLTNKSEGAYLNSKKGQQEIGKAIADAILTYKENTRVNSSSTTIPVTNEPGKGATRQATVANTEKKEAVTKEKKEDLSPSVVSSEKKVVEAKAAPTQKNTAFEPVVKNSPEKRETQIAGKEDKPRSKKEQSVRSEDKSKSLKEVERTAAETKKEENAISGVTNNNPKGKAENEIVFKVQLLASAKTISLVPSNFNGLNNISKEPYQKLFRYMYGSTRSYEDAQYLKSNAVSKGFKTCYIVAYKQGVRIPVPEAIKYLSQ